MILWCVSDWYGISSNNFLLETYTLGILVHAIPAVRSIFFFDKKKDATSIRVKRQAIGMKSVVCKTIYLSISLQSQTNKNELF